MGGIPGFIFMMVALLVGNFAACFAQGSASGECDAVVAAALDSFRQITGSEDSLESFRKTVECASQATLLSIKHQVFDMWAEEDGSGDLDAARASAIRIVTHLVREDARQICPCPGEAVGPAQPDARASTDASDAGALETPSVPLVGEPVQMEDPYSQEQAATGDGEAIMDQAAPQAGYQAAADEQPQAFDAARQVYHAMPARPAPGFSSRRERPMPRQERAASAGPRQGVEPGPPQLRRLPVMRLLPQGAHRWDLEFAGNQLALVHAPASGGRPVRIPCGFFGMSFAESPDGTPRAAMEFRNMRKDGIELSSIAGLAVGRRWALDLWLKYDPEALKRAHTTLLRAFASWMKSGDYEIRVSKLQIAIYADGVDHATGLYLPDSSDWQHLTMAMLDADMVWYVNDTKLGAVRAQSLIRQEGQAHSERINAVLNVGGSTTSHDGGSKGAWLGRMWGITLVTDVDRTPEQALERKRKADMVGETAIHDILRSTAWAGGFARQRVAMVGNSAKLTQGGGRAGSVIDAFDEVIRFNANPTEKYEGAVGSKRSIEVINDLFDFCGCNHGDCCSRSKRVQFWRMLAPQKRGNAPAHVILFQSAIANEPWFKEGAAEHRVPVTIAPVPEACGAAINLWAERHGVLTRFPHWSKCRSGMRMLVLLLLHGVKPTLAGFDTEEKTYAHYTGLQTGAKSETKNAYYLEQQLISELFRLKLIDAI